MSHPEVKEPRFAHLLEYDGGYTDKPRWHRFVCRKCRRGFAVHEADCGDPYKIAKPDCEVRAIPEDRMLTHG